MDAALKLPLELTTHPNPPFLPMKMTVLKHAKAALNTSLLTHCRTGVCVCVCVCVCERERERERERIRESTRQQT
jgi:hypothetical protein